MDDQMTLQYHYISPLGIGDAKPLMAQWLRENPNASYGEAADKLHELTGKPVRVVAKLTSDGRIARRSVSIAKRPLRGNRKELYRAG
jgi:hypothetical protein